MQLRFSKMHGLGNDFVIVDLISQRAELGPDQIRFLGDRHRGVGFDQLLLVEPPGSPDVDFRYRIFNADGSEAGQCGNGARCFASFVRARRLTGKSRIAVETCSGRLEMEVLGADRVRVNMGVPVLEPGSIPFAAPAPADTYLLETSAGTVEIGAVSMGNPHAVLVTESVADAPLAELGPEIEHHARFPERTNVGFMEIVDRGHVRLRVHERGVVETSACGTGACAAVVVGRLRGLLDAEVEVELPGGTLSVRWEGRNSELFKTGPATHVFEGRINL